MEEMIVTETRFANDESLQMMVQEKLIVMDPRINVHNQFVFYVSSEFCRTCHSSIRYCQSCANRSRCLTCFDKYFLDAQGQCVSCPPNSVSCHFDKRIGRVIVLRCKNGFYYSRKLNKCVENDQHCINQNEFGCLECSLFFRLDRYKKNCLMCGANCVECSDESTCLKCLDSHYFDYSVSKSRSGLTADSACLKCPKLCKFCNKELGCLECHVGNELMPGTDSEKSVCMAKCVSGKEFRHLQTKKCTSCLACRFCIKNGVALCRECPICQNKCDFEYIRVNNWMFLVQSSNLFFDLEKVKTHNPYQNIRFRYHSANKFNQFKIYHTQPDSNLRLQLIIPLKSITASNCSLRQSFSITLKFLKDDEKAINLKVKQFSSAMGYTTLSTVFISIAQTNSLYSLVGLMNMNKVFSFLFIMNTDIQGISKYINRIDTLLNFDESILVDFFVLDYDSHLGTEYKHISWNMGESKIQEMTLFNASYFICVLLLLAIRAMGRHYRKVKLQLKLLIVVNSSNCNFYFERYRAKYKPSFVDSMQKEFEHRRRWWNRIKRKIVVKLFSKEHLLNFVLLSTYTTEFAHLMSKLTVMVSRGSASLKARCMFLLMLWTGLFQVWFFMCAGRFWKLANLPQINQKRRFKELVLYKTNFLGLVKIVLVIMIFLFFNKYFSFCLCSILVVQLAHFSVDVYLYRKDIAKKLMSKYRAIFLLGLENLLTMAILVIWTAGYTSREKESSLVLDSVMLIYNLSKIANIFYTMIIE